MTIHPQRIIIAISGASGQAYAIKLLRLLAEMPEIETHLVISRAAHITIAQETTMTPTEIEALADMVYAPDDIGASIASGSFAAHGMIVVPCTIKTLSSIAHSYNADLITRAADVQLKEGRPLLLVVRETPLHLGHLRLMVQAAENGAIIFPPSPTFYDHPQSLDALITATAGRMLARLGIANDAYQPWAGL